MNRAFDMQTRKSNFEDLGIKKNCSHDAEKVCSKCVQKALKDLQKQIEQLEEDRQRLSQRLKSLRGLSKRPLCWNCKHGTCVKIQVLNANLSIDQISKEPWQENEKNEAPLNLWSIVCAFPGYAPGLAQNRFIVETVLDCNNFEERKNKSKKSKQHSVK